MIDPTASDCKKVTRYVNTAANIQSHFDKIPTNQTSGVEKIAAIKIEPKTANKLPIASKVKRSHD